MLADISHPSGLIATQLLNDPLTHCDIVSSTTHKTLRGPRGGVLLMRNNQENPLGITTSKGKVRSLSSVLDSGVFPGTQGGPLEHVIAAKAVAFGEALQPSFASYIKQVRANARALAAACMARGYYVLQEGTDNHLLLIDLRGREGITSSLTGAEAEEVLDRAGITVNKNMVPFDDQSALKTSGVRLGTAAVTTRGLKETDMEQIATYIDEALKHRKDAKRIESLRQEVKRWISPYPLFEPAL